MCGNLLSFLSVAVVLWASEALDFGQIARARAIPGLVPLPGDWAEIHLNRRDDEPASPPVHGESSEEDVNKLPPPPGNFNPPVTTQSPPPTPEPRSTYKPHPVPRFPLGYTGYGRLRIRSRGGLQRREADQAPPPAPGPRPEPGTSDSDNQAAPPNLSVLSSSSRDVYSWFRLVCDGKKVQEVAFTSEDNQTLVIMSLDDALTECDFVKATIVYDFSTPIPLQVDIPVNGPCFLTTTDLTYQQALESVRVINGSTAVCDDERSLDGRARSLTQERSEILFESHLILRHYCRNGILIPTLPEGDENTDAIVGPSMVIRIPTLTQNHNIRVPDFQRNHLVRTRDFH